MYLSKGAKNCIQTRPLPPPLKNAIFLNIKKLLIKFWICKNILWNFARVSIANLYKNNIFLKYWKYLVFFRTKVLFLLSAFLVSKPLNNYTCKIKNCIKLLCSLIAGGGEALAEVSAKNAIFLRNFNVYLWHIKTYIPYVRKLKKDNTFNFYPLSHNMCSSNSGHEHKDFVTTDLIMW